MGENIGRKKQPKVSVGMPVYNGEKYIRRAIESVLAQEYTNFELVISDNASKDKSPEIYKEYAKKDKRIRFSRNKKNIGLHNNFEKVVKMSKGQYFMWFADDDFLHPKFLSTIIGELEKHKEFGVCMCGTKRIDEDDKVIDTITYRKKENPNQMTNYQLMKKLSTPGETHYLFCCGIFRTDIIKKAMPMYNEVPGQDQLLMCALSLATKFRYVDKFLYTRQIHSIPGPERLPNEKYNIMKKGGISIDIKILYYLGRSILGSDLIPTSRKLLLPIVLSRYWWILVRRRIERYQNRRRSRSSK